VLKIYFSIGYAFREHTDLHLKSIKLAIVGGLILFPLNQGEKGMEWHELCYYNNIM